MVKPLAEWVKCPGMNNPVEHYNRDGCYSCAPWWVDIPICPVHKKKLATSGYCTSKVKVNGRGHFVAIGEHP